MAIKRGETYRNNGDGRIYKVVAVGANLSGANATTVAFKQVVNAKDEAAVAAGTLKLGKKSYFRTKSDFQAKYSRVTFQAPVPQTAWRTA